MFSFHFIQAIHSYKWFGKTCTIVSFSTGWVHESPMEDKTEHVSKAQCNNSNGEHRKQTQMLRILLRYDFALCPLLEGLLIQMQMESLTGGRTKSLLKTRAHMVPSNSPNTKSKVSAFSFARGKDLGGW